MRYPRGVTTGEIQALFPGVNSRQIHRYRERGWVTPLLGGVGSGFHAVWPEWLLRLVALVDRERRSPGRHESSDAWTEILAGVAAALRHDPEVRWVVLSRGSWVGTRSVGFVAAMVEMAHLAGEPCVTVVAVPSAP